MSDSVELSTNRRIPIDEREELLLAPTATRSRTARRRVEEEESDIRSPFQRDRDRILYTEAFRKLGYKTQVFPFPSESVRNRQMHTLEVTQIGRTIGRALGLNEDLIEAIGLGHDLGHTPFGHAGETALAEAFPGFRHNEQSLRVVDYLERDGRGLNLTDAVRDGILRHSKQRDVWGAGFSGEPGTPEGKVILLADGIAYINHDLDDALGRGRISEQEMRSDSLKALNRLGKKASKRIDTLVRDVIDTSSVQGPVAEIRMSPEVYDAAKKVRESLFELVYDPMKGDPDLVLGRQIVHTLFAYFCDHPSRLPKNSQPLQGDASIKRRVVDHIASMTDFGALSVYKSVTGSA